MSKDKELLSRFGANLAESMGANRTSRAGSDPGSTATAMAAPTRHDGVSRLRAAAEIEVGRIAPDPAQPRTEFDPEAIDRLARSIAAHGQLQPIAVRWSEAEGRYLIVAGERRWRASVKAGRPTVAAVVVEGEPTGSQVLEMQLIENCLREDLRPIEQARAFRALMGRNGWSAARLAEALHLTGASVTRALSLLELPEAVRERVESGELAPSVAYEVSKLDDPNAQREVAEEVVAGDLNRAEAIAAVRRKEGASKGRGAGPRSRARGLRLPTARLIRTAAGPRITLEHRRGLTPELIEAALAEALEAVRAELGGREAAA